MSILLLTSLLSYPQNGINRSTNMHFAVEAAITHLVETDRVEEYHRMGHSWPPLSSEFVPPTKGWIELLQRRFAQADQLSDREGSYDAYVNTINSMLSSNYTQYGWGITRAPPQTLRAIYGYIQSTVGTTTTTTVDSILDEVSISELPWEEDDQIIDTAASPSDQEARLLRPKYLKLPPEIISMALQDVLPIVQAWVGEDIPLVATTAYGLRIYQNTSRLLMHTDFRTTHIIGGILHIGHDTAEPWPLVIEGLDGTTNQVNLQPGDLLLYESSKCWHGRLRRMDGKWYTSLYLHYRPEYDHRSGKTWSDQVDEMEWKIHHRLPPQWYKQHTAAVAADKGGTAATDDDDNNSSPNTVHPERLVLRSSSAYEVGCPDNWCAMKDSVVVEAPAPTEFGKVFTANGEIVDLLLSDPDLGRDIRSNYDDL